MPAILPSWPSSSARLPKRTKHETNKSEYYNSFKKDQLNKAQSPSIPSDSGQEAPSTSKMGHIKNQELAEERTPVRRVRSHKKLILSNTEGFLPVCASPPTNKIKSEVDTHDPRVIFSSSEVTHDEVSSHRGGADVNASEPLSPVLGLRRSEARSCSPLIKAKRTKLQTRSSVPCSHKVAKRKLAISMTASVKRQIISEDETIQTNLSLNASTGADKENQSSLNVDSVSSNVSCNNKTRNLNESLSYDREPTVTQDGGQEQDTSSSPLLQPESFKSEQPVSSQSSALCIEQAVLQRCEDQSNSTVSNRDLPSTALTDLSSPQETAQHCVDHEASQNIVVASEGTDSQVDYNIEVPLTPTKHSVEGTDVSEVSSL